MSTTTIPPAAPQRRPAPSPARSDRALVDLAMRRAVQAVAPALRTVVGYHLGWWEVDGTPRPDGAGKGVRPALALLSARTIGADARAGVDGAVAVELVHAFSLLHDDVMDRDTTRRHRPAVWAVWGEPTAILAGDALQSLAVQVLLASSSTRRADAATMLVEAVADLVRGQCEDMAFTERAAVGVAECERMAAGKTGALVGVSTAIGALLAGAPAATVAALRSYGCHVGLAFQLVDDLLGIWGDPAVTGKPVLADLRERKQSLPVAHALEQDHLDARHRLAAFYERRGAAGETEEDLAAAAEMVEACGSRWWASQRAAWHVERGEEELAGVDLEAGAADELRALGRSLVGRCS